jgi:hypothetical protein
MTSGGLCVFAAWRAKYFFFNFSFSQSLPAAGRALDTWYLVLCTWYKPNLLLLKMTFTVKIPHFKNFLASGIAIQK